MKKLFLMAAMMLASAASFAQHAVGTFTVQPKVGVNIANLTKVDEASSRVGLAVGAEFEYQASDIISVSFGALYSQQGTKLSGDLDLDKNLAIDGDATLKLDYINIPILANVYVAKGLAVKLGIQPGFKVNSSVKVKTSGVTASSDINGFKSVDFSIPIGLSYEYNNFVLDGRYNFGVTKIAENSDCKHSVFQITLGYKFAL